MKEVSFVRLTCFRDFLAMAVVTSGLSPGTEEVMFWAPVASAHGVGGASAFDAQQWQEQWLVLQHDLRP